MLGPLGTRGPLWVTSAGLLVIDLPLLLPGVVTCLDRTLQAL